MPSDDPVTHWWKLKQIIASSTPVAEVVKLARIIY